MGLFRRKKKEEIKASVGDAEARAVAFGEMTRVELEAYLTQRRAEWDELTLAKKAEFAAIRERIDRLAARERFTELVENLPEHSRDELANLLIEED